MRYLFILFNTIEDLTKLWITFFRLKSFCQVHGEADKLKATCAPRAANV